MADPHRSTPQPACRARPDAAWPSAARSVAAPLGYAKRTTPGDNGAISDIYARYAPQRIETAGAADHPSPLVESVAMAAVVPPMPTVIPTLPQRLIAAGALSAAQLETIIMAEGAHARDLPCRFAVAEYWTEIIPSGEGGVAFREGYFLGDGTGAGKGRQVAGLILSNWLAGRTRAIWLSGGPCRASARAGRRRSGGTVRGAL